ncbi:MAG: methylenetetrahydrofolate reductase [Lachnospiraceae bacterium]|nr:methylenetetrahydrofolate reductase [NAD(P)H] [Lachnospiraceae bacterium]
MKIIDLIKSKETTLSFEVFPPKTSDRMESVEKATEAIAALRPDFMSVTYGAGGGTSDYTIDIAQNLQETEGVPMLAHLTCVSSNKERVRHLIGLYQSRGIENIMALRGDIPEGGRICDDYHYAIELIEDIRSMGDFCIGGACYPEGHPESTSRRDDMIYLKQKVDAGLDFITSQMFFNNDAFYSFMYRARDIGIEVPILAGIMPIINARQIRRSIALSGTEFPERFRAITDRFGPDDEAMKQAGIIYATEQIIDLLAHGVKNIHVYSMNRPDVAQGIRDALSHIL